MEWLILALALLTATASPLCPAYTCQPHELPICATYFNQTVRLNSIPCPDGFECRLEPLMNMMTHAYETDFSSRSSDNAQRLLQSSDPSVQTYYCQAIEEPVLAPQDQVFNACFERNLEKVMVSGKFPVPCYYPGFEDT